MLLELASAVGIYVLFVLMKQLSKRVKQNPLRKLPGPPITSWWTGSILSLWNPFAVPFRERITQTYGRAIRIEGLLGEVQILVSDPAALSALMGKHRDVFDASNWLLETNNVVFGPGLLAVSGYQHYKQRKLLNPVFAPKHLHDMVPAFHAVSQELTDILLARQSQLPELDISDCLDRVSLEAVGRAVLGYTFGALDSQGTDYSRAIKEFGPTIVKFQPWRPILPWLTKIFPRKLLRVLAQTIPWKALNHMVALSDAMCATAYQVFRHKRELIVSGDQTALHDVGEGKDLMSILLRKNMAASDGDSLTESDLLGQMTLLLLAATDTTSSALSRILNLLSHRADIQEKLRQELVEAVANEGGTLSSLSYDALASLPYLDAIIKETLRLYPPLYIVNRVSSQDVVLPLSVPIRGIDGHPIHELVVPANTTVGINILGVNRDPEIWGPDACEWNPERWLSPLPISVTEAHIPSIFSNIMTFVSGPRACIGYNFALVEMRVVLSHLVSRFSFSPSDQEIIWKLGGVVSPFVKDSSSRKPELPIQISAVNCK